MNANYQTLDKTSRKIKALSKILSFLINKEDRTAIKIILDFIGGALDFSRLDQSSSADFSNQDKFKCQFNLERVIELVESTSQAKTFLKDEILYIEQGSMFQKICDFLNNVSLV